MSLRKVYDGTTIELADGLTKLTDATTDFGKLNPEHVFDTAEFTLNGKRPEEIIKGSIDMTYFIHGLTGSELIELFTGQMISITELSAKFKTFCDDFDMPITIEGLSMAGEFAGRMLYTVGPSSRKDKSKDFVAQFNFPVKFTKVEQEEEVDEEGTTHMVDKNKSCYTYRTVFVSTFRKGKAPSTLYEVEGRQMVLTLKQAGLLATIQILRIVEFAMTLQQPRKLMTPLAGAIFSTQSIGQLSKILGAPEVQILKTICASAQSSGHLLPESDINCAAACVFTATRNMKDKNIRSSIITKTMKQYISAQKELDSISLFVWMYFATGGVPEELSVEGLTKIGETASKARQATSTGCKSDGKSVLTRFMTFQIEKGDASPEKHFANMSFPEEFKLKEILAEAKNNAVEVPSDPAADMEIVLSEEVNETGAKPKAKPSTSAKMDLTKEVNFPKSMLGAANLTAKLNKSASETATMSTTSDEPMSIGTLPLDCKKYITAALNVKDPAMAIKNTETIIKTFQSPELYTLKGPLTEFEKSMQKNIDFTTKLVKDIYSVSNISAKIQILRWYERMFGNEKKILFLSENMPEV